MYKIFTTVLLLAALTSNAQVVNALLIEKVKNGVTSDINEFIIIHYDSMYYSIEGKNFSFTRNDAHGIALANGVGIIKIRTNKHLLQYVVDIYDRSKILYVWHYNKIDNAFVSYTTDGINKQATLDYVIRFIEVPEGLTTTYNK